MPRIEPVAWEAPPATPLSGPYAVNDALADVERWPTPAPGPEDLALDHEGSMYTGLQDGRVIRFTPDGRDTEILAATDGRPLGIEVDRNGRLVICDAFRGLRRLESDGTLTTLADAYEGERFLLTNNSAVASDGTIYFSVSSRRHDLTQVRLELLEHRGTGRLFSYGPEGSLRLLLDGLQFANGVALSGGESFVAVAETPAYRITRLWLRGDRAGQTDTLIERLPGLPDNLTYADGMFWAGIPNLRQPLIDRMASRPWMRRVLAGVPQRVLPEPSPHALVLGLDEEGNVTQNLQDPDGGYAPVMTALPHDGYLYLGSISESAVGRVPLGSP